MGNDLSVESSSLLNSLFSREYIKYKDAARFWKHICYYSISDFVNNKVALRLLKSHDGPLTTCQLSWLHILTSQPYDGNGLHVLYSFPALKDFFSIKGVMTDETPVKSINDDYEGTHYDEDDTIFNSFPELKTKREPTFEEAAMLSLYGDDFNTFFAQHDTPVNQLLLAKRLCRLSSVKLTLTNLAAILDAAKSLNLQPHDKDRSYAKQIFNSLFNRLPMLYCSENSIPKEMWLDVFKYIFFEPYLYHTALNAPEFVPIVFMGGSLRYLIGYPAGSSPPTELILKDMIAMFTDPVAHQAKIREINLRNLRHYSESIPYPIIVDENDEKLNYPPCELVFADNKGKVAILDRRDKISERDSLTQLSARDFVYHKLVDKEDLGTFTELLHKMKEPDYFIRYENRTDHTNDN
jgi:hypothetical protein